MSRYCKICGIEVSARKQFCDHCKKERKRQYAREHLRQQKEAGIVRIRYGIASCSICGEEFIKNRPEQHMCFKCYKNTHHRTVYDYNKVSRSNKANTVGRQTILNLGFKLNSNLCVHHLDENPENNNLENLIIINRKYHSSLHRFLEKNWSLLLKSNSSNLENCWNILRVQLTTTWLETMNVKVIKTTEIGQSAAEPLNENIIYKFSHEEGSETMYQAPKSNTHGEDIVQTQTS